MDLWKPRTSSWLHPQKRIFPPAPILHRWVSHRLRLGDSAERAPAGPARLIQPSLGTKHKAVIGYVSTTGDRTECRH
jgi:hypothetical protein